jgi:hypothetical protein
MQGKERDEQAPGSLAGIPHHGFYLSPIPAALQSAAANFAALAFIT